MDFVNYMYDVKENVSPKVLKDSLKTVALLLNPFAPHLSEECYELAGGTGYASIAKWPKYDENKIMKNAN